MTMIFPARWIAAQSGQIPWRLWSGLACVAVVGSLLYGGSLSLVLPGWKPGAAGLWLALSAGLAWCAFIPVMWMLSRNNVIAATTACLLTMAAGEAVLFIAALINGLAAARGGFDRIDAGLFNVLMVALSNAVMAAVIALRMRRLGVPVWQTLGAWMLFLNGSGAFFFAFFLPFLHGL